MRLAGVDLLAAAKNEAALVPLVDDKEPLVALQAAIAIKSSHPDLAAKAVDRALAAEDWTARAGAANYLAMALGKSGAIATATRLTSDAHVGVRLAAARVLLHAGKKATAMPIFTAALADADHGIQAAADLASVGDPAGIEALSKATLDRSRSPEQRSAAVAAHRTAHRVTPGLVAALADDSGIVRIEAAEVLGVLAKERE